MVGSMVFWGGFWLRASKVDVTPHHVYRTLVQTVASAHYNLTEYVKRFK